MSADGDHSSFSALSRSPASALPAYIGRREQASMHDHLVPISANELVKVPLNVERVSNAWILVLSSEFFVFADAAYGGPRFALIATRGGPKPRRGSPAPACWHRAVVDAHGNLGLLPRAIIRRSGEWVVQTAGARDFRVADCDQPGEMLAGLAQAKQELALRLGARFVDISGPNRAATSVSAG
ncbi:MAG: hypothetical protein JSS14_24515 [Proteobacteria bacterium]|nr:hypothetical protein [Pseudomonadota bacterium]